MVTFTFYAQNFGRWEGPTNPILSLYDSWLSGRDTETLLAVIPKKPEIFALTGDRDTKHLFRTRATW